jgi:hypothetical protein
VTISLKKQIVARIWEFLGSPSLEELKGRTLYDLIGEKEEELQRLQTRCARLRWRKRLLKFPGIRDPERMLDSSPVHSQIVRIGAR